MDNVEFIGGPNSSIILTDILDELNRQDRKFGPQRNLPISDWSRILGEEVGEVFKAINDLIYTSRKETFADNSKTPEGWEAALDKELTQVMAVCFQMRLARMRNAHYIIGEVKG